MTHPFPFSSVRWHHFLLPFFILATNAAYAQSSEASTHSFNITIENHKVTREKNIRVTQGDRVTLVWTTDEPLTVHLHGYDVEASLKLGMENIMRIDAHATGRFPVTVHGNHAAQSGHAHSHGSAEITLIYLEVYPE